MNKKSFSSLIILVLLTLLASGCTKSIPINYSEGINTQNINVTNDKSVGIMKFIDNRSISKSGNAKGKSFIATQSPWQFALTYEDEKYCPVNKIVNRIFFSEMQSAGFNVKNIDMVPSNLEKQTLINISKNESVDYLLGGEILNFEFANDAGVWTVTSRQNVTLSLTLISSTGEEIFTNSTFSDSNSKNEGMGILHSTNVNKLVNVVFKEVLIKVFKELSSKIAINKENIHLNIAFNNKAIETFILKNENFVKI